MRVDHRADDAGRERDLALRKNPLVRATPEQIEAWLEANVKDLPSARKALLKLALAVRELARRR